MRCTNCGTENAAGKKFCSQCGSGLALRCPKCGSENAPGSRFCGDCGTALTSGAPNASPSQDPSAAVRVMDSGDGALEGERKTV
ncbi:zinc ribbon domain-containing protein, partial [Candidatus Binatus sp.]|uniref:zinc ribbon domain-containing protein n=1 Tax=Candidatus Binatus sp. TaxID=2811406 RepID=UPI003CC5FE45